MPSLPSLPSQTVHLHALEMDVLEIVEALDHQELDPNLGTPNSLLYSLLSILFSFTFWLVVSFFSNVPSLLGMESPTGICWNHGISSKRLLCLSVSTSEPLPGLCRACARVQANRAEEISAGADWEIKRSLNQNPIWSSRFFTHFYDEECPEAFK